MQKLNKKKVSFDLEPHVLSEMKKVCEQKNIKQSDFIRFAVREKINRESEYLTIYVPYDGTIEKYVIKSDKYEIDIHEACEAMREHVGAKKEGILRMIKDSEKSMIKDSDKKIIQMIKDSNEEKLAFFTK